MNVYLAMNITDIDDKILNKANLSGAPYKDIANQYYQSFVDDLKSLRIESADCHLKVTENMDVICDYIRKIYDKGFAYYSPENGSVNFDYEKFENHYSIKNAINNQNAVSSVKSHGKKSPRDFALWKVSKENEPFWDFKLNREQIIQGRPGKITSILLVKLTNRCCLGWHVECSALSDYVFRDKLDIHFGGFDLIFPHHHCESCCSHAYLYDATLDHSKPLYSSARVWLHSGHLILRSEVSSKKCSILVSVMYSVFIPSRK